MAFTFWKNNKNHIYDIQKYWDEQNRVQLKERYDHRNGAFDWDLQMRLKSNGAKQICSQEYKHWRETGVAFTFPEFEYSLPNKTFAMDLRKNGINWFHRGYVGDMTVGPFITFGMDCREEKMLKSNFGTNECRATDIVERNVYEIMWEIQHEVKFDPESDKKNFRKLGAVTLRVGDAPAGERSFDDINVNNLVKYDKPLKALNNVKIHFLTVDDILNISQKQQYHRKFDIAFVANNYFTFLKDDFVEIVKNPSLILFETKKFSILKPEEINKEIEAIKNFCKKIQLKPITNFSVNVINSVLKYKKME
jgi:dynein assembly factor 3, axonemal